MIHLSYNGGYSTLIYPGKSLTIHIPENLQDRFKWELDKDQHKGVYLTQIIGGSKSVLTGLSRRLSDLFGADQEMVRQSVGDLCEERKLTELDEAGVRELAGSLEFALFKQFESRPFSRRSAIATTLFSDPINLEVEMLGWQGLMESKDSVLLDHRRNMVEGTLEALYEFRECRYLIATCGTGKVVVLPVGDEVSTCEQSQTWLAADTVNGFPLPRFFSRGRS